MDNICGTCEYSILTGKDTIYCTKHNFELNILSRCDSLKQQEFSCGVYEYMEATSDRLQGLN